MHETENPPNLELTWPRTNDLLVKMVPAVAADPEELERLERIAVFSTGFSMQAWIDLSWMFFSFWGAVKFQDLMANRSRGYLNPEQPHEVISHSNLARAIETLGVPFADLPGMLAIGAFSAGTLFDLTPFRARPLWIMPDGLVLCVDAAMLLERLGPHVFWGVMNALDSEDRRRTFSATWGLAFERYCTDAMETIFRGKKWRLSISPRIASSGEELFDALATRDDSAVLFECKGTYVTSAQKYSRNPRQFFRGLSQKFGRAKHGGVFQLARGIARIWLDQTDTTDALQASQIRDVFPVLLVQDPILRCGPVARVLSDRFQTAIARVRRADGAKPPKIWPLTVMTADDLDRLASSVRATGQRVDALLKRFHRTHPSRMISLGDFLGSAANADFGFPAKVDALVKDRFRAASAATMQRFRASDYALTVRAETDG